MMSRPVSLSLLVVLSLGACATDNNGVSPARSGGTAEPTGTAPLVAANDGMTADPAAGQQGPDGTPHAIFREVWQSKRFQRALAESYLRDSEMQPALTLRQAEFRKEVMQLIGENQIDSAISRLKQLQGDNAVFDFLLGNLLFKKEQYEEAAVEYAKAVEKTSSYLRAWQWLAMSQLQSQQYAAAVNSFVRVISLGGGDLNTYSMLGTLHQQLGDFIAAESAYRMAIMMEPHEPRWRMMLAQCMFGQNRYGDGAALIGTLLDKEPNRADLWYLQARAYVGLGETKKASENLEIAARLGGASYESQMLLGDIYYNEGSLSLAVDAYLKASELDEKGDHRPILDKATRIAGRSDYVEARRLALGIEATYAERLDQESKAELLKLRARLAVAAGATEEQVELLKQIVQENPLDGDALMQLGRHYQNQGDTERAIFRFEQAAQTEEFAVAAKMMHATLLVNEGEFGKALPLLRQVKSATAGTRDDVDKLLKYVERAAARGGQ